MRNHCLSCNPMWDKSFDWYESKIKMHSFIPIIPMQPILIAALSILVILIKTCICSFYTYIQYF